MSGRLGFWVKPVSKQVLAGGGSLLLACAVACGGDGGAGPTGVDDLPPVASVDIAEPFFTDTRNRHTGDVLQLDAEVRDADGTVLRDRRISWTSRNSERAAITPDGLLTVGRTVAISEEGVFVDSRRVTVVASVEEIADSVELEFNGWSLGHSTDPITLQRAAEANLGALIGAEGPPRLHVRCRDGRLDVFVSVTFVTGSGQVRLRFSGQQPETQIWNEAQDFHALFYPDQDDSPFAMRLTQTDTLLFEINQFLGADVLATFVLPGAGEVVPAVLDVCS